ncbi:MAG: YebC/PmpR family DNA-binding transcriptional regulator [Actinobacteria bacterium]|jgi:YebC/PmpR family DNA-binding regulatory protein|nr:YebC/PmpR family DNA-binding transcriptional regulator [Actinomycetota bacterium]
MSGHSKWATTKHRKAAVDKARGKLFAKLIRQIEVAAREGGGDVDVNATLRTMYEKARAASVPMDTIERAIKRGTGELEGVHYEAISYEGYGHGGVAIVVECLTDNKNRTGADIRSIFGRNGGSMAEPGSVLWQFDRVGQIYVDGSVDEDAVMMAVLDAGAEDVVKDDDGWLVTCQPAQLQATIKALDSANIEINSNELALVASNAISIEDESDARKVIKLIEALDDHDDVQNVWSNFDIPDSVLAAIDE